jgi:hypothetical protein
MSNQCTGQCSTCQSECQCLAESNQCGTCQTCQCSTQSNQTPTPVVTISKTGSTTTSISCSVSVANGTATRYQWIVGQSLVAETTSSSYTFTMLNCGANYYCQVIAYNGSTLLNDDSNWFTTSACPVGVSVYMNDNGETFIDAGASYPGGRTWKWYIGGVLKGTTSGTDSSSYHFGSLTCSNVYNISCSAYDGTGALLGSGSANIHTLDCPPNPRPDNFIWDTPKVAGQKFNLSAEEWVNFVSRIIGFRYYVLGDDTYNFTYPNPGDVFTAAMFNQAVTAIDDMSPPTSPPATIADPQPVDLNLRDKVTAARLNGLVASLNSIP